MAEVCSVTVSLSFIRIDVYESIADYEIGRPYIIYVILRNFAKLSKLSKSEVYELLHAYNAKIEILDEGEEAIRIYNGCKRARHFISIPPLMSP